MDNYIMKKNKFNPKLERIAITCGDAGENHQGMKMEGQLVNVGSGFNINDLNNIKSCIEELNINCEMINLSNNNIKNKEAAVLIIRNFINEELINDLYSELTSIKWDNKYYDTRRKKVLNKNARENLLFLRGKSQEPDYENKKGRIVDIYSLPIFNELLDRIFSIINDQTNGKAENLIAEGNRYLKQKIINNKLKNVKHGIGCTVMLNVEK